jgi:iron complex outermembrane receptor protein
MATLCLPFAMSPVCAQTSASEAATTLPEVEVRGERDDNASFSAKKAGSSTKSDLPLSETPQSISVLTREQLDSRQVQNLNEALQGVAGVVAGNLGRRGWDDFVIRGQRASESIYVDGLKLEQGNWVSQESFGVERIEVLKGPASVNFGLVQPGGMVNMVSKRPRTEAFNQAGVTFASDGFKQGTFDLGRPLSDSGKTALRVNGLVMNSDDPTDFVYFKNRYLAPSLSLDLGLRTDFTILSSYSRREYVRQQGLPLIGTLRPNSNGAIPLERFVGEPGIGPYQAEQYRIGYALEHRLDSGWKLRQNFRYQNYDMDGRAVFHGTLQSNQRLQNRTGTLQDVQGRSLALDTNIERRFQAGTVSHTVMAGLDLNNDRNRNASTTCTLPAMDLFNPVYGVTVTCPSVPRSDVTNTVRFVGLYLRDQVKLDERLNLVFGVRRDQIDNTAYDHKVAVSTTQKSGANTGNIAALYKVTPGIAPYISYATSFLPVGGTDFAGAQFKPETGKQAELGIKFELDGGRTSASVALYELKRQNVTTADLAHNGFSVQTGEQRSKGFEAEIAADLRNGWNLSAAYAFTDAILAKDATLANVGKPLNSVPRHSASLWSVYRFRQGALAGWGAGAGLRHESEKSGFAVNFEVPAYTVADASLSYIGNAYRLSLNFRNLFDKTYFAGVLNNNVVPLGDPRQIRLNAVFDF